MARRGPNSPHFGVDKAEYALKEGVIYLYCDGSYDAQQGGVHVIAAALNNNKEKYIGEYKEACSPAVSNGHMELRALVAALKMAHQSYPGANICIRSDYGHGVDVVRDYLELYEQHQMDQDRSRILEGFKKDVLKKYTYHKPANIKEEKMKEAYQEVLGELELLGNIGQGKVTVELIPRRCDKWAKIVDSTAMKMRSPHRGI